MSELTRLELRLLDAQDKALAVLESALSSLQNAEASLRKAEEARASDAGRLEAVNVQLATISTQLKELRSITPQVSSNATEIGKLQVKAGVWGVGGGIVSGLALTAMRGCESTAKAAQPHPFSDAPVESFPWYALTDVLAPLLPFAGLGALLVCLVGLSAYGKAKAARVRWYPRRAAQPVSPEEVEREADKTADVIAKAEKALTPKEPEPAPGDWREDLDEFVSRTRKP